jgi:hypothetical protein
MDAPLIGARLFKRFDALADAYASRFPNGPDKWEVILLQARAHQLRLDHKVSVFLDDPLILLKKLLASKSPAPAQKTEASHLLVLLSAAKVGNRIHFGTWEKLLVHHLAEYPADPDLPELELKQLALAEDFAPARLPALAEKLSTSTNAAVAQAASDRLSASKPRRRPKSKP